MYRIIDKQEEKTNKAEYTFEEVKNFFKPSEDDLLMDKELLPMWENVTDILSLKEYLKELGQIRYDVIEMER